MRRGREGGSRASPHCFFLRYLAWRAARRGFRDAVMYLCDKRGISVNVVPEEEGLWLIPDVSAEDMLIINPQMTPLLGATYPPGRTQEDFALQLLTIPDQTLDLDLNRRLISQKTLVYLCVQSMMPRVVKELVRRGADFDLWDEDHHTPLCAAATQRHLPALRFFLEQYQARGGEELKRALSHHSLLGHVFPGCTTPESAPLDIIRYLVQEWGQTFGERPRLGISPLLGRR